MFVHVCTFKILTSRPTKRFFHIRLPPSPRLHSPSLQVQVGISIYESIDFYAASPIEFFKHISKRTGGRTSDCQIGDAVLAGSFLWNDNGYSAKLVIKVSRHICWSRSSFGQLRSGLSENGCRLFSARRFRRQRPGPLGRIGVETNECIFIQVLRNEYLLATTDLDRAENEPTRCKRHRASFFAGRCPDGRGRRRSRNPWRCRRSLR